MMATTAQRRLGINFMLCLLFVDLAQRKYDTNCFSIMFHRAHSTSSHTSLRHFTLFRYLDVRDYSFSVGM